MSIKKVKLTEADLNRIVKKVVNEQSSLMNSLQNVKRAAQPTNPQNSAVSAASNNPKIKALAAYLKQNKVTPQELNVAITINKGAVRPSQGTKPAAPQKQGGFISNAVDTAKQGIQKGLKAVQGYEQQGLNKLSQGLNSVANAVKPKQQGGVAQAPRKAAPVASKPTTPATGTTPTAQLSPEQLKAIQGQAKRV